jgi:hypothetical protein
MKMLKGINMKPLLLGFILLGFLTRGLSAQNPAEPGHFDYYLLNLSWSTEFVRPCRPVRSVQLIPDLFFTGFGRRTAMDPGRLTATALRLLQQIPPHGWI